MVDNYSPNSFDYENKKLDLENQLTEERRKIVQLQESINERQERYVRREQEYRRTIADYEAKLRSKIHQGGVSLTENTEKQLNNIRQSNNEIINWIGMIQHKTTSILQDQEKEIVKKYNEKLNKKSMELEEERKRKVEGLGSYNEREQKLIQELEIRKASVEVLESKNKFLHKQNSELKVEFYSQESDADILSIQLDELKQKNERLRDELFKIKENSMYLPQEQSVSQVSDHRYQPSKKARSHRSNESTFDAGQKYEAIINKLRKMLDVERNNLRAARTAYARELQSKTELEQILRQCVEDVKQEIVNRKSEMRLYKSELAVEDQEKILEVLFSQERVLTLLYDKTFPPRSIVREPLYENLESKYLSNLEHIDQNIQNIEKMYDVRQDQLEHATERARISYDQ